MSLWQFLKIKLGIVSVPSANEAFVMSQLLKGDVASFSVEGRDISVRAVSENEKLPSVVSPSLNFTLESELHPLKALLPIFKRPEGNVTDVKLIFLSKAYLSIAITLFPSISSGIVITEAVPLYFLIVAPSSDVKYW